MKNRIYPFSILFLLFGWSAGAQQIPGLQSSNYGGLYRATYNPSVLGGSKYKFQVNIGALGGSINYRYFVFLGKNSLLYPLLVPHSTKELYGRSRTMGSLIEQDPVYLVSEIRWPSVMFSLGKYQGLAIQFRSRGIVQGHNIPDPVRNLYFRRLDTGSTPAISGSWGNFNLVQQSFSEMSVSYGVQLLDLDNHKLRAGVTARRVFGARISYLNGNAGDFAIRDKAGAAETSELVINDFAYESGYSQVHQSLSIGNLFDSGQYGAGWGYDLGATYEFGSFWANEKEKFDDNPQYILRLAASLTDIGSIHYKTDKSRVMTGTSPETVIGQQQLEQISDKGAEGFMEILPAQNEGVFQKKVHLPQAFHLEADIQLIKGFFLNLAQTKRHLARKQEFLDVYQPESFTLTPRFEDEDSDFAFPISFIKGNKRPVIGAMAHFGPVFLGFSNLGGLIKKSGARGSMVYIGVSAWKLQRKADK
ncbi:hypothetical protein DYBT9275_04671 [Dyadobacter sp. CECT 9275]|uniref:DUF5723 domain-containing protein n=1 Tax=Dyadobacter helix TaxID=2822344 RepID=A0A916JJC9_9BACT|nr:DUF5723 family protein [Dyadobacter sp. CECT 9275]CAG5010239.1 hypothetical protein DYBT9275_04671 [Dyadobacter sp. CECT 9275]